MCKSGKKFCEFNFLYLLEQRTEKANLQLALTCLIISYR